MKIINGVILAAGTGSTLDFINTPKPLVRVGDHVLIVRNIKQLEEVGVTDVYIVVGHRANEIKRELFENHNITAKLHFIEQLDSSSGGMLQSILSLLGKFNEDFYLSMGDLFLSDNPYSFFTESASDVNILYAPNVDRETGAQSKVYIEEGEIKALGRKLDSYNGLEIGVYKFGKSVIGRMHELYLAGRVATFEEVLKHFLTLGEAFGHVYSGGEWFDINNPATFIRANLLSRTKLSASRIIKNDAPKPEVSHSFRKAKELLGRVVIARGLLGRLGEMSFLPKGSEHSMHFIITDNTTGALYGDRLLGILKAGGYNVELFTIPDGETSKSTQTYVELADTFFARGMDKYSYVFSLGGGVVNNLAGFLASTLYRGIGLIHIPTSMMAQVDAAIDFKQAVNSPRGKNLLGSYYPPDYIFIDPELLLSLPLRHINNGIAESIKHALTQDREFYDLLIANFDKLDDPKFLETVVRRTVDLKILLMNVATRDNTEEMLLQYGHSVGHAIEHLSGYDLLHGESISIGMCVSAELAELSDISDQKTTKDHYEIFRRFGLPVRVPDSISADDIVDTIRYDKHHVSEPHMALLSSIAKPWIRHGTGAVPVSYDLLREAIRKNRDINAQND